MRARVITKLSTQIIWFSMRMLSKQFEYKRLFSPSNYCCTDKQRSVFREINENTGSMNLQEAATRLSEIVSNGYLELIQEVRVCFEANPFKTEAITYYHASWEQDKTWAEVYCLNFDDIVSYIKLLRLPAKPCKATSTVLLSPWFLGNIFHEFAHSLEIDHAPHSLRRIGQKVFGDINQPFSIFENPGMETFGKHSFSDAGTLQQKRCLVKNGTLLSCVGDYQTGENLYMGLADGRPLLPRTVCLEIVSEPTETCPKEGMIVLGGVITTVLMRPSDTLLLIKEIDFGYYIGCSIISYSRMMVNRVIRLNEILKRISFVSECNIKLPEVGGFCKKDGAVIRSIQRVDYAMMSNAKMLF